MQQRFTQEADFRQERDFGQKIGATFEFIGAHAKPLGKCLLYFVVPFALLAGIGLGITQREVLSSINSGTLRTVNTFDMLTPIYLLAIGASSLSYVLLAATVYGYIRLRIDTDAQQEITPTMVRHYLFRYWLPLVLSGVCSVILSMTGMLLFVIPGIYLGVALSLVWVVQILEEGGIGYSLKRSEGLVRGKWWSTFGLSLVIGIIIGILGMIFQIPQLIGYAGKALHWDFFTSDIIVITAGIINSVGHTLLYAPLMVALAFQYFNLVERKEGFGLRMQVMSLGQTPAPTEANHHLRPDDEGEY
ncbi:hypothetical protein [Hymenobacter sp. 102]|uniref:hypothetical protein n=1 Tax=Hymenobacter sp. 102 TaxID=3403152 RepID=UPI003CF50858